jgi:hypothetical protein
VRRLGFRNPIPRAWLCAIAAMVVLLQGLIPAAAIAHNHADHIRICTLQGVKLIRSPQGVEHHHFGGLACEQCVLASFAAVGAAPPPQPVAAAWTWQAPVPPAAAAAPPPARAPPRPFSRAPPTLA